MQTRRVVLTLFAFALMGVGAFAYLGSRRKLPPTLASAYGTVATLASSASLGFADSPAGSGGRDAGVDADPPVPPRVTQTAPLSSAQLGAPLVHGRFVSECGAPDDMKVVVKVTIKKGRAVAVDVRTRPPNPAVAACVERATREKSWDVSPSTQHATVTY